MREWYLGLAERERRFVSIGGIAVVVLLIAGGILKLNNGITQARQSVAHKQLDLAFIQQATPELRSAAPSGAPGGSTSLVVIIDGSARESGLGKSLTSSEPTGDGGLRTRLDHAPFDGLVAWLARISQQHGVRVETAEIESAGEAGYVNASLVLKGG